MGKVQQASTSPHQSRKIRRHNQKPTLAPQTDEWHWVVFAIAVEEDIDTLGDLTSNSEGNESHRDQVDGDGDGSQEDDTY
ncbi:hypothetical protein RRF57_009938 [Xylaria bambusicola]|uniref:Uncharacterized protein n=1 Tax=Xylaria bambusicola TaxID=326684 RepID=A0AAN7UU84_9PEZI